jgi:hypothetical protein
MQTFQLRTSLGVLQIRPYACVYINVLPSGWGPLYILERVWPFTLVRLEQERSLNKTHAAPREHVWITQRPKAAPREHVWITQRPKSYFASCRVLAGAPTGN